MDIVEDLKKLEFKDDEDYSDDNFSDLDEVTTDDEEEIDFDDDNYTDDDDDSDSDDTDENQQNKRRRYHKNYSTVKCPIQYCRKIFQANRIRYTFIRGAIVYTCPICKSILSINNRSMRRRFQNYKSESGEQETLEQ
jgi:hypothetical protein